VNSYESDLKELLGEKLMSELRIEADSAQLFFYNLSKHYPINGSKIDWSLVPDSVEKTEKILENHKMEFVNFFDDIVLRFGVGGNSVYAGDALTDFILVGDLRTLRDSLLSVFDIPQHHYLAAVDYSWCMAFTTEGDMAFGFSPEIESRKALD
jgi:hypothetical protein